MADGITRIAVEGFKSISKKQSIDIAPLTILAGANSSGKSSIMQPLLLLKQTLEAQFNPGPLFLSGPNVRFTSSGEFFSRSASGQASQLSVDISAGHLEFRVAFVKRSDAGLDIAEESLKVNGRMTTLRPNMSTAEIYRELGTVSNGELSIFARGFFLYVDRDGVSESPMPHIGRWIDEVIQVPALRGSRSRTYPVAAVGRSFPGTFDSYTASAILSWQKQQTRNYEDLNVDLQHMGIEEVFAHPLDETAIELRVYGPGATFSIADVGFGISQTLHVLVALRAASEGQLVYLEEPEIHLHPRAQVKLADVLASAAKRGVRVVSETHSSLLLRAIQTLVAKGELAPDLVRLHWFSRDSEGVTQVRSVTPDQNGAFGDWPEDFGDVALQSEKEYLDAVESKLAR